MNFKHGKARQAEIIKCVQKDAINCQNLTEDLSDILKFVTGPKIWIRYNNLCKILAEISYHGFLSLNRLQTLGEEYTGIIQIDGNYISLPNKVIQLSSIILEFGGEIFYLKILNKIEKELNNNNELRPEAKNLLINIIIIMRFLIPYIKGFHKALFYLNANKYQLSKRLLGINYILIRNWININQSLYGYKILGIITFIQLSLTLLLNFKKLKNNLSYNNSLNLITMNKSINNELVVNSIENTNNCQLCLDVRKGTSLTICGHLFCWKCIIDWLDERAECPVCRESMKKSNVIQLMNYQ